MASTPAKRRGRRSQIAAHPERTAIEMARAAGVSLDKISARYGVQRDAIARHWHSLPDEYKAALIIDIPREELVRRAVDESGNLLDHFKLARNLVEQQLIVAKGCGDSHAVANLSRAAIQANLEVGKLSGEIARLMPGVTINNTQINILERPEFHALERGLLDIASRIPDAKQPIIDLVTKLRMPEPQLLEMERAVA